jgi:hypothetical protein
MGKKRIAGFLTAVAVAVAGCQHDISLRNDDSIGTLCVNGYIDASDSVSLLKVTRTDFNRPQVVRGARVEMRVNGEKTSEEETDWNGCTLRYRLKAGDVVRIDVYDGGDHIWSEGVVPDVPRDVRGTAKMNDYYMTTEGHRKTDSNGVEATVEFSDDGREANYYRFTMSYGGWVKSPIDKERRVFFNYRWKEMWHYGLYDKQYDDVDTIYTEIVDLVAVGEFYYPGVASLLDEETGMESDDMDFMTARIENEYKVVNDSRFDGEKCRMTLHKKSIIGSEIEVEEYLGSEIEEEAVRPVVEMTVLFKVYAIDEEQYYFLKVMNAMSSEYYDDNEGMAGALRLPSNVNGGSGNVFLTNSVTAEIGKIEFRAKLKNGWGGMVYREEDYY